MADGFVTILDKIGDGLKKFFTSPVASEIEQGAISVLDIAFPAVSPLLSGIGKALATAQALAAQAVPKGETTAQATALALSYAQEAFTAYETATGTKIETAQQQVIIQKLLALLAEIPAAV